MAKENGLLYSFSKNALTYEVLPRQVLLRINEEEKLNFFKLQKSLRFVNCILNEKNIDFLYIKLFRNIDYAPRDVDILVKRGQTPAVLSAFKDRGLIVRKSGGVETKCTLPGLLNIDFYEGFEYLSTDFIDQQLLWANPRRVRICSTECLIPNLVADYLTLIIHSLLGHRFISMLDFLYAKSFFNNNGVIKDLAYKANQNGWNYPFLTTVSLLKEVYNNLYSKPSHYKSYNFPYPFQPKFILSAFNGFASMSEKRKLSFILSSFVDKLYYDYTMVQRIIPIEMPDEAKMLLNTGVQYLRGFSGDRKELN